MKGPPKPETATLDPRTRRSLRLSALLLAPAVVVLCVDVGSFVSDLTNIDLPYAMLIGSGCGVVIVAIAATPFFTRLGERFAVPSPFPLLTPTAAVGLSWAGVCFVYCMLLLSPARENFMLLGEMGSDGLRWFYFGAGILLYCAGLVLHVPFLVELHKRTIRQGNRTKP